MQHFSDPLTTANSLPIGGDALASSVGSFGPDSAGTVSASRSAALSGPNLLFVDSAVENYQQIIDAIEQDTQVFILNQHEDGILQISSILASTNYSDIASLGIVSHGSAGSLLLGAGTLDSDNLASYQDELTGWSEYLSDQADVLLFGCDVGKGDVGQSFLDQLSALTEADIAASTDLTGHALFGGDWDLEATTGSVEAILPFGNSVGDRFVGVLAPSEYVVENDPNFTNEVVISDLAASTSAEFLPDGRILIAEKAGKVFIANPQDTVPSTSDYLTLPDVLTSGEKGLLDVAVDPDFAANNYIYLFYTKASTNTFQISRFTHQGDTADLNSETVIWTDSNPAGSPNHFGAALNFGPDGKIYLTTGDKASTSISQNLERTEGKVLRINKDGSIPTDNPFYDGAGPNADEIWAYGLRNPFRADWDLEAGNLYIGDVGQDDWEEVNRINVNDLSGPNFGWGDYEGPSGGAEGTTDPLYAYPHTADGASSGAVIGGSVYRNSLFPDEFQGAYFFGDFTQDYIRYLKFDETGAVIDADTDTPEIDPFNFERRLSGNGRGRVVDDIVWLDQGPDGALYYINFNNSSLRRITYTGADGGNQAPQIDQQASTATLDTGLTYDFNGAATDPDGDSLTYLWDFGDGSPQVNGQNVSHTYASNGEYEATLVVSDGQTATPNSTYKLPLIQVGNPPTADITIAKFDGTPLTVVTEPDPLTGEPRKVIRDAFRAGETLLFEGLGTDSDGTIGESNYDWKIQFLHDDHNHPEIDSLKASSGSFETTSVFHGFSADLQIGYTFNLTVTDADGLRTTERIDVLPEKVDLTFNDNLPGDFTFGLKQGTPDDITDEGLDETSTDTDPFVLDTAIGFNNTVTAPATREVDGFTYVFDSWSSGETTRQIIFPAPEANQTYIANYVDPNPAPEPPVAQDDGPLSVAINSTNNRLDVLSNDSDPDPADTLSIVGLSLTDVISTTTAVTTANGGSVSINGAGDRILYTPQSEFEGQDVLYYTVEDSTGQTATASVTIGVAASNALPVTNGLVLRLDAGNGVTTDGADQVTGWSDLSGSGNDLTGLGDPRVISGALNGQDVIRLDGDGDTLQRTLGLNNLPSGSAARTVFMVAKYNSSGYGGFTYGDNNSNQAFGLGVKNDGDLLVQAWGGNIDADSNVDGTGEGWLTQSAVFDSGTLNHYKDGTLIDSRARNYNTQLSKIVLGAEIDGAPFVDMEVAEILVFDQALSETDRQQIENYFQQRYFGAASNGNTPPIANDDTTSTEAGVALDIDVRANDSDIDGNDLSLSVETVPTNGTAIVSDNGTPADVTDDVISYTPNGGFIGLDTFTYTVNDGNGGTDSATVSVDVTAASGNNTAPAATDDSFAVAENSGLTPLNVLTNDSDADISSGPGSMDFGTYSVLEFATNGKPANIAHTVSGGGLDEVVFEIDASNVGGPSAHFHQPAAPPYLTQHNLGGNGPQINFTLARQDGLAFSFEGFKYTSGSQFPGGGDLNGGFTVIGTTATGQELTQVFGPAATPQTFQQATLTGPGWNNLTSVRFSGDRIATGTDVTQELNIDDIIVAAPALSVSGVDSISNGGTVNVAPDGETITYAPAAGFAGDETFSYTVNDGNGGSDTATVTVTVNNQNDAPTAADDSFGVIVDSVSNPLDVLANDTDPDTGDTFSIVGIGAGVEAMFTTSNGGTVEINATNDGLVYTPAVGFNGDDTFVYTMQDAAGVTSTATVTVSVATSSVLLSDDFSDGTAEGWVTGGSGLVGATVVDGQLVLDNKSKGGEGWVTYQFTKPASTTNLTVSMDLAKTFGNFEAADQVKVQVGYGASPVYSDIYTSTANPSSTGEIVISDAPAGETAVSLRVLVDADAGSEDLGIDNVLVIANDGSGGTGGGDTSVTAGDDTATTNEGIPVDISVLPNDSDIDGDDLSLSIDTAPTNGAASTNDNGTPGNVNDDFITYTPNADFAGTDTFTYLASDGNGGSDTATVTVTVNNQNDAPTAADDSFGVLVSSSDNPLTVLTNDVDPDTGDTLTIVGLGVAAANTLTTSNGGSVAVNGSNDGLLYTPAVGFSGIDSFAYTMRDTAGETSTATVTVTVAASSTLVSEDFSDGSTAGWIAGGSGLNGIAVVDGQLVLDNKSKGGEGWVSYAFTKPSSTTNLTVSLDLEKTFGAFEQSDTVKVQIGYGDSPVYSDIYTSTGTPTSTGELVIGDAPAGETNVWLRVLISADSGAENLGIDNLLVIAN